MLLDDAALDDPGQERLAHILDVVRVLEEHAQIALNGRGIAHHELHGILD
jgi:hypothetical protein